jgi:hypothetical protein
MKAWISVGTPENWETAIAGNIWGVVEGLKSTWEKLQKGDILLFYATFPIKGIIGVGRIKNKFKQDKPLWAKEIKENRVIWPYRYDFEVEFLLPRTDWESKKVSITGLNVNIRSGLNPIKDREAVKILLQRMDEAWNTELIRLVEEIPEKVPAKKVNIHDEIKEKLLELGRIEGYIAEKEYVIPDLSERLDVVWRRVVASVPTYAFEIQIGGNLHQALSKLKHAYDIWNSNIFLISTKEDLPKINKLLSGTFHEIRERIRVLDVEKINEVYELQVKDHKLKKEIGFR